MKIEIELNIGLKPAAERLLGALLASVDREAKAVAADPAPEPENGPEQEPEQESEQEPAQAPEDKAPANEPAYPSDDDLRTLMDVTIARFCGTGWRDETDPAKVRLRKSCTRAFKEMSKHLGAEKPSQIAPEKRAKFCDELDNLVLNPEQTEVCWSPF